MQWQLMVMWNSSQSMEMQSAPGASIQRLARDRRSMADKARTTTAESDVAFTTEDAVHRHGSGRLLGLEPQGTARAITWAANDNTSCRRGEAVSLQTRIPLAMNSGCTTPQAQLPVAHGPRMHAAEGLVALPTIGRAVTVLVGATAASIIGDSTNACHSEQEGKMQA